MIGIPPTLCYIEQNAWSNCAFLCLHIYKFQQKCIYFKQHEMNGGVGGEEKREKENALISTGLNREFSLGTFLENIAIGSKGWLNVLGDKVVNLFRSTTNEGGRIQKLGKLYRSIVVSRHVHEHG